MLAPPAGARFGLPINPMQHGQLDALAQQERNSV